ncbi:right-handed parallel beta-helix repeat-containing protein, partial [candidate division KSB1 bacterium]
YMHKITRFNTVNYYGFILSESENIVYKENTLINCKGGISTSLANHTFVVNNNFIDNSVFDVQGISKGNIVSTNYYNKYDEPSEGCSDLDTDGICDKEYELPDGNIDEYPITEQNGWENLQPCIVPTDNMVISADVKFCPGTYPVGGITINANNVILDCNNAHLISDGTGIGITGSGTIDLEHWMDVTDNLKDMSPILNDMGGFLDSITFIEDVTIKNCRVSGFEQGINTTAFKNLLLQDNEMFGNDIGVSYVINYLSTTTNNKIHDNKKGAFLISLNSSFDSNELYGNEEEGIIDGGVGNTLSNNIVYGNQQGILSVGFGNKVLNNNASGNAQYGIGILWSNGTEVFNNIADQNNKGIGVAESTDVKVHDNTANSNKDGITVSGLFSQGTTSLINISNNIAMQNTRGGIVLSDGMFSQMIEMVIAKKSSKGHHVVDSIVFGNNLDNPLYDFGIIDTTGSHVEGNTITGNTFNGGGVYDQYPENNIYCDAGQGNTYGADATIVPGDCQ